MILFNILNAIPMVYGCNCSFKGIATDCCNFYLTSPACCKIMKFDKCLKYVDCYKVCRPYTALCFDSSCCCFWALSDKRSNCIFKLDCNFCEIDCLAVTIPDCGCVILDGISCNCKGELVICGSFGVATVSKHDGCFIAWIDVTCNRSPVTAISDTDCGSILCINKAKTDMLIVNSDSCNEFVQCCLPEYYNVEDMTRCSCEQYCTVYILVTKRCSYSYILVGKISYIPDKKNCCTPQCMDSCKQYSDRCHSSDCTCDVCPDFDCHDPCCPPPPDCNPKDCCKSAADIIESISLVEAALSHILNAEGEKIQKILCQSDDPCEIMKVNDAVHKIIISITHLEQVLFEKLQTAHDICKDDKCHQCEPKHKC